MMGIFPLFLFKVIMIPMLVNNHLLTGFYIAILFLIIIYDWRNRRILNIMTLPVTILAILLAYRQGAQSFYVIILGAFAGFIFFYMLFILGRGLFGAPALGFGDVKLAMLLGAMVGLQQVFVTLALGMLLAGGAAVVMALRQHRRARLQVTMPYGMFLGMAGIFMLIWNNFL